MVLQDSPKVMEDTEILKIYNCTKFKKLSIEDVK